jgi:fructose-1,6-bisphosphatase/inositol monophosphatase family enzyme
MKGALLDQVAPLLHEAAERAILPRFRQLARHEIEEKSPGELVTVADREAEAIIAERLERLLPGSRAIGEEACAADPSLLDSLAHGTVWLIDPLDGTANFAAGESAFAVMVALLRDGTVEAGWMFQPVTGRLARAELGSGAWLDGRRIEATEALPERLRGSMGRFMPDPLRLAVSARLTAGATLLPGLMSAGVEYPAIGAGERDFAFYWRTLAWDHAAGALFLNEAGGRAARLDGSAFVPTSDANGILVARTPAIWDAARALIGDI